MKKIIKNFMKEFEKTIVFFIKLGLYIIIFLSFFMLMGIPNQQLLRMSRTSGITMSTFVVVGLGMTAAYGTFDIGKRKSKPIISSIGLATVITDIVTYIQLMIMNVNASNNTHFQLENIGFLILAIICQITGIVGMTYLGNYVFFRINPPEKCLVVTSSKESFKELAGAVSAFKKQYQITEVKDYRDKDISISILKADTVFVYNVPVRERTEIIEYCYRNMRNIYFNPEIADVVELSAHHVIIDDISLISAPMKELSFEQRLMKRLLDLVGAFVGLVLTSPIWASAAIAIKVEDHGSVFFKQKRATKNGQVFEVYKFRTMRENVKNYSVVADDDRITKVGRFLRKFRIDELPQLYNILKGEMSLVGPRPEMLENVYMYTKEYPEFAYRLRVKAGLTGYAQIAGKYNTTPKYKLVLDLMYIEKYSIVKDIKLILQTLIVLLKPDSTEAFAKENDEAVEKYLKMMDECWDSHGKMGTEV